MHRRVTGCVRLAFVKKKLLIIMRLWMMTIWMRQLKTETEVKPVKTPEMSLKYRQMSSEYVADEQTENESTAQTHNSKGQ